MPKNLFPLDNTKSFTNQKHVGHNRWHPDIPANVTVNQGQSATLSVSVAGTEPFTYQWRRNGVAIEGATGASLALSAVQAAAAGSYTVTITNSAGSVTSAAGVLTAAVMASATTGNAARAMMLLRTSNMVRPPNQRSDVLGEGGGARNNDCSATYDDACRAVSCRRDTWEARGRENETRHAGKGLPWGYADGACAQLLP